MSDNVSLPRKRESSILYKYNKMDSCFRRNDTPFLVILFKNNYSKNERNLSLCTKCIHIHHRSVPIINKLLEYYQQQG